MKLKNTENWKLKKHKTETKRNNEKILKLPATKKEINNQKTKQIIKKK
jgi:hypothetical protein